MYWLTPEFHREGRAAVFVFEVLELPESVTAEIVVEHKDILNQIWTTFPKFSSAQGVMSVLLSGINEKVRVRCSFQGRRPVGRFPVIFHPPQWRTE